MPYYKLGYESDSIEGLKAIQDGVFGEKASYINSINSENVAPPPLQKNDENADVFSGIVQAPPSADIVGDNFDNMTQAPPPSVAQFETNDAGKGGEIQPPPNILDNPQGNAAGS